MKRILFSTILIVLFALPLTASGNWSTEKVSGEVTVCYQSSLTMYCAHSESKKTKEVDLKQFLSVYMQFSDDKIVKNEMVIHPGIKRLIRSSRADEGSRILKGVFDYLSREGKRKKIVLSTGATRTSQKLFSPDEQKSYIELIRWPKFITVTLDAINCGASETITFSLVISSSLKKSFTLKRDQIAVHVINDSGKLFTVGSITKESVVLKPGTSQSFPISVQMTGEMDPTLNYELVPIVKKVKMSKKKFYVNCRKK
ncbi:hypothetical protein KAH37_10080 [bacterium]|nr:hypothetical protein [bacterium]